MFQRCVWKFFCGELKKFFRAWLLKENNLNAQIYWQGPKCFMAKIAIDWISLDKVRHGEMKYENLEKIGLCWISWLCAFDPYGSSQIYKAALEAKGSKWNLCYSSAESNVLHWNSTILLFSGPVLPHGWWQSPFLSNAATHFNWAINHLQY